MIVPQTNLVGAIVEVYRYRSSYLPEDAESPTQTTMRDLINRGEVRAVTSDHKGGLILWIEELDAAESGCWFGEDAPVVEWENGGIAWATDYACASSDPGRVRESQLVSGENDRVEMKVIRRPPRPAAADQRERAP